MTGMTRQNRISRLGRRVQIAATVLLGTAAVPRAHAQTLNVLHAFTGGASGNGNVFQLVPIT